MTWDSTLMQSLRTIYHIDVFQDNTEVVNLLPDTANVSADDTEAFADDIEASEDDTQVFADNTDSRGAISILPPMLQLPG
ncbi:hypothetical protein E4U52_006634 [Claviceps spartinae]|nr:hypothetical protein E4U52_006634 [Claviceps spartinae]